MNNYKFVSLSTLHTMEIYEENKEGYSILQK
jgi:hypothetical protein